ncbi:MAG: sigma-54 dependent transcriptional regulator [Planctomycetales bacterium]
MKNSDAIDLLVVDDDDDFRDTLVRRFSRRGFHVGAAANANEALQLADRRAFDVAIIDMVMPGPSGLELLEKFNAGHMDCEVIMLTGQGTIDSAVQAMKLGAFDYLTKPCPLSDLEILVGKARDQRMLRKENKQLKTLLSRSRPSKEIIGTSPAMQEVFRLIQRAGPSEKSILIQGESGTGKELVAQALHENSPRIGKPLVVVTCAALSETLLESELFGHEKGAFTGAISAKPGLFEVADGGTLFVDEIGEMPVSLQSKLLRVLEDGSMRRVGSIKERRVNVRLLAATNRNLAEEMQNNRFREDLYYRINVMSLELPRLVDRENDLPLLLEHFLGPEWTVDDDARRMLEHYKWPGNVRQLINAVDRAKIMSDENIIRVKDLPPEIREPMSEESWLDDVKIPADSLGAVERSKIIEILRQKSGNKTHAAKALGVDRRRLYRLLEKHNVREEEYVVHG